MVVENFKEIERIPAKEWASLAFPGIMKTHSIKVVNIRLLENEQTCTICTPSEICATCKNSPATITTNKHSDHANDAVDNEEVDAEWVDDDEHGSDEESDIEYDHNATDDTNYGYPIWAKYGIMLFLGKTYDVSPYDSQRSHPSMDLGVKWDFVCPVCTNCCEMSGLQICLSQLYSLLL